MTMESSVKDRWKDPRGTIAQKFRNNDYGYVFHAGQMFVEFLKYSNLTVSQLRGKKILDYGCGTGRISRFLALTGAYVVGYDPTPECIKESEAEGIKTGGTSVVPRMLTSNINDIKTKFDIVVCINVLDHLTLTELSEALSNIHNLLEEGGECFLWVSKNMDLPVENLDHIRKTLITDVFIVKGIKQNGKVEKYIPC